MLAWRISWTEEHGRLQSIGSHRIIYKYLLSTCGEGNGTPLQYSCLENPMDGGAWWATVHGVAKSHTRLRDFTFAFHFHALEKEMATHSSVLAWRIPGTGEPGRLPSMGSHRVGHDWSDLAAAAALSTWSQSYRCFTSSWGHNGEWDIILALQRTHILVRMTKMITSGEFYYKKKKNQTRDWGRDYRQE